jgi:hypothetical protein
LDTGYVRSKYCLLDPNNRYQAGAADVAGRDGTGSRRSAICGGEAACHNAYLDCIRHARWLGLSDPGAIARHRFIALVEQVDSYLAATPWSIEQGEIALVQGDLASLNLMVSEANGALKITGLIDWGDAKIGAASHEFISPGVHMYRGDRNALRHWYEGYQLLKRERAAEYQHVIMARAMLYYADGFAKQIERIPGAAACSNWAAMASVFWQMDTMQEMG